MITTRACEHAIIKASKELDRVYKSSVEEGRDLLDVTTDAKRIAIELYEFLCKFQGQEEA